MKYMSCLGKVLLLLFLCLLDETSSQRRSQPERHNLHPKDCPPGTKCKEYTRCRQSILSKMSEPSKYCGLTYNGKQRICCPEKIPTSPSHTSTRPAASPATSYAAPINRSRDCGAINRLQSFVMGGKKVNQGALPWMVSINMRNEKGKFDHICTGSLITKRHVLSAAHCFHTKEPSLYVAKIGDIDRKLARAYNIMQIEIPRNYKREQFYYDIAVLTLSTDVNKEVASPICLPESSDFIDLVGKGTTVAGWGSKRRWGKPTTKLLALSGIPVISNKKCNDVSSRGLLDFHRTFPRGIIEGIVCAGFMDGKRDTCEGDSGGPLMYLNEDNWYVVGVVSFGVEGEGCSIYPDYPSGYTRVSKYLDWIQQKIRS